MICKKCGREYEDDMPNCLWCDAINEEHPNYKNSTTPDSSKDSEANTVSAPQENSVEDHPAGTFMWSAMLLGLLPFNYVLIAIFETLIHKKALKENKSRLQFFGTSLVISLALIFIVTPVINVFFHVISKHPATANTGAPSLFNFIVATIFAIVQGFVTAKLIAKFTPDYNKKEYRRNEEIGISYGIAFCVIFLFIYATIAAHQA